jgi:hypothetical protein
VWTVSFKLSKNSCKAGDTTPLAIANYGADYS